MGWGGWWMGPFGWIIGILVIGLLITGLWRLFRGQPSASETGQPDRALDILRERFARGEINEDEFEARKNALGR